MHFQARIKDFFPGGGGTILFTVIKLQSIHFFINQYIVIFFILSLQIPGEGPSPSPTPLLDPLMTFNIK